MTHESKPKQNLAYFSCKKAIVVKKGSEKNLSVLSKLDVFKYYAKSNGGHAILLLILLVVSYKCSGIRLLYRPAPIIMIFKNWNFLEFKTL
jgi:hypothetical protein